jgi:hypothetical protein
MGTVNPFIGIGANYKNKRFSKPAEKLYAQVAILSWSNVPRLDVFADIEEFAFPDHLIYTKPFADLLQDIARMNLFNDGIEKYMTSKADRMRDYVDNVRFISYYYKPRNIQRLFNDNWPGPGYYGLQLTCKLDEHAPIIENT